MKVRSLKSDKSLPIWQVGCILVVTVLLTTWLKQDRLSEYWQQAYQATPIWQTFDDIEQWHVGAEIAHFFDTEPLKSTLEQTNSDGNDELNHWFYQDYLDEQALAEQQAQQQSTSNEPPLTETTASQAKSPSADEPDTPPVMAVKSITLSNDKQVFFAGDSLMQGVAPWVMRELKSQYDIKSIDLSKPSTGLSYSSFFDWPATIEKTLNDNRNIGALIVFLGPNDPLPMPDPDQKGKKYVNFATPRWQEIYKQKIQRILKASYRHKVQVLWVTPPAVKNPKLSEEMAQLQQIIHQSIDKSQALVIDSRPILEAKPNAGFVDSMTINGKITKVRTADGVHFTPDGQKLIAKTILSHFDITSVK